jgi:hypothetical protein
MTCHIFAIGIISALLAVTDVFGCRREFIPQGGVSAPVGVAAGEWLAGYSIGLEHFRPVSQAGNAWGVRASVCRWIPDADQRLKTGDRTFRVEQNRGWRAMGELSLLGSHRLAFLPGRCGSVWVEGGAGMFYLRNSGVRIRGVHTEGNVALYRDLHPAADIQLTGGLSAEASVALSAIEPALRVQHIFSDGGFTLVTLGLGLLAH